MLRALEDSGLELEDWLELLGQTPDPGVSGARPRRREAYARYSRVGAEKWSARWRGDRLHRVLERASRGGGVSGLLKSDSGVRTRRSGTAMLLGFWPDFKEHRSP